MKCGCESRADVAIWRFSTARCAIVAAFRDMGDCSTMSADVVMKVCAKHDDAYATTLAVSLRVLIEGDPGVGRLF